MDLTIFHYHLQPGGVTSVVSQQVTALAEYLEEIETITLVCGRVDHTEELYNKLYESAVRNGVSLLLDVNPALDYLPENAADEGRSASLASRLFAGYSGSIWWIHNYQLGKNPIFTRALVRAANEHPELQIVFHIHDFPECSRYQNLEFLRSIVTETVYPVLPNARYVVINGRDREYLIRAGIPESQVFLLNNPVEGEPLDTSESTSAKTKKALADTFGDRFPDFDPDAPLVLYPVRTIRRKNVLELALLTRIAPDPVNLVVTLPGVSEREKPYSDVIEKAYHDRLVRGLWGIGHELDAAGLGFLDLVASADLIACSSIQEGFGLLYVDTLRWGHPLLARKIDVLDGIADVLDVEQVYLYDSVPVPLDVETKRRLEKEYDEQIRALTDHLSPDDIESLRSDIASILGFDSIDFSYLDLAGQLEVLRSTGEHTDYTARVRDLNRQTVEALLRLSATRPEPVELDPRFTKRGFADTVRTIVRSFDEDALRTESNVSAGRDEGEPASDRSVQSELLRLFARKEFIRLIYSARGTDTCDM